MNRENVEKWVDALEFGDYKQTREALHVDDSHCAFGVADVIRPRSLAESLSLVDPFVATKEWLSIDSDDSGQVIELNDRKGYTLPEIGAWVRDNWLKEE